MMSAATAPWPAPVAHGPIRADVSVPGSKSLTNRYLVLAHLAEGPSVLRDPLDARDTRLMAQALGRLGSSVSWEGSGLAITPAGGNDERQDRARPVEVDCGLAGTVMRFVPLLAALRRGDTRFDGDAHARQRPMSGTLEALEGLGVEVVRHNGDRLPFTVRGTGFVPGGELELDASASSQFVSAVLLAAPRFSEGLTLRHTGSALPSLPHVEMTLETLRGLGVDVRTVDQGHWRVEPGPIAAFDQRIEPDLSNAGPFLAAAVATGGQADFPRWPARTTQPGDLWREILPRFGAQVTTVQDGEGTVRLSVVGPHTPQGVDLDLSAAGELAPTVAGLCVLADSPSTLRGIAHLRGHETDRLRALATELSKLGARVEETDDGLRIEPGPLRGTSFATYDDHRMATTAAVIGLKVPGVLVENVGTTAKTLPDFTGRWIRMVGNPVGNGSA